MGSNQWISPSKSTCGFHPTTGRVGFGRKKTQCLNIQCYPYMKASQNKKKHLLGVATCSRPATTTAGSPCSSRASGLFAALMISAWQSTKVGGLWLDPKMSEILTCPDCEKTKTSSMRHNLPWVTENVSLSPTNSEPQRCQRKLRRIETLEVSAWNDKHCGVSFSWGLNKKLLPCWKNWSWQWRKQTARPKRPQQTTILKYGSVTILGEATSWFQFKRVAVAKKSKRRPYGKWWMQSLKKDLHVFPSLISSFPSKIFICAAVKTPCSWKGHQQNLVANHSFVAILPSLRNIDLQGVSLRLGVDMIL